ncbi:RNA polymerase sigma factor [Ohtaekwangia koreensis]|uniref:RNA polymerase sigma-70 factor, ECF subfamily n=1 Tax=Ohtaekwangia koreensis TaxID=688867 RepID=A0A1T5INC5_9BACT|nr:RNA polymerase sigma-70 factor [Ohtaekwangia koreensis]SKC40552.1 RNA polymerase sigma-70 factor, ECF subfamily [Ohtaekwangia koreensis]
MNPRTVLAHLPPYQENSVLHELALGSESAFKQLYDRYWQSIYKVTKRYTKSSVLAEDIVQEIFSTLWNKRSEFTEVLHLEYYLMTMARNLTYKTLRKLAFEELAKSKFTEESILVDNTMDDLLLEKQYEQLLQQAVGLLPSQQKQVFQLAKVEGLSHEAIAKQLNISRLTVKTHMAKALQFIRHYLQPHVGTYVLQFVLFRILIS